MVFMPEFYPTAEDAMRMRKMRRSSLGFRRSLWKGIQSEVVLYVFRRCGPFYGSIDVCIKGCDLTSSSGAYGTTIAEHVVMVILEVLRRQSDYAELVSRHIWKRGLPVRSIFQSRITLLGTGDIGTSCAERLNGFKPACMIGVNRSGKNPNNCFDRTVPVDRLEEMLPETDILILSLPKTTETYHLLNAEKLSRLPDGALVVNVGRGTVIDQNALEQELRKGRLYAAPGCI